MRSQISAISFLVTVVVSICSCGPSGVGRQTPSPHTLKGVVNGGQQPVSGATIQLYAAGTGSYGAAATPLISGGTITGPDGFFDITGKYTCPTLSTNVYIVATGGNPGMAPGTNNAALAMMTALGPCGNLTSSTFILINEQTTVASVYSLAPFMGIGGGTMLGTSSTNAQGLTNAFSTVNNLVDTGKGTIPGPALPTGSTAPISELATLADILAQCVNSDGTTACNSLFTAATPSSGSAPTNTIDAMLNIANNPVNNVSALYDSFSGTVPFQPIMGSAPNDWTLAITYSGGGLATPYGIAIDGSGNVWAPNTGNGTLSELSNTGVAISPTGGYTGGGLNLPHDVVVDLNGAVWVANLGGNGGLGSISKFDNNGNALSSAGGITGGGINQPAGLMVGIADYIWVANQGGSDLALIGNDGTVASPSGGYTGSTLNQPSYLAMDVSNTVWAGNFGDSSLTHFNTGGNQLIGTAYTGGGLAAPSRLAIDRSGNLWLTNGSASAVSEFNNMGTALSGASGFSNGGLGGSSGLGIDGDGNVWTANVHDNSLSKLSSSGALLSGPTGYRVAGLNSATSLAIDGSGNVWVTNFTSNSLTEVVGAAAPITTPVVSALKNSKLGMRP